MYETLFKVFGRLPVTLPYEIEKPNKNGRIGASRRKNNFHDTKNHLDNIYNSSQEVHVIYILENIMKTSVTGSLSSISQIWKSVKQLPDAKREKLFSL